MKDTGSAEEGREGHDQLRIKVANTVWVWSKMPAFQPTVGQGHRNHEQPGGITMTLGTGYCSDVGKAHQPSARMEAQHQMLATMWYPDLLEKNNCYPLWKTEKWAKVFQLTYNSCAKEDTALFLAPWNKSNSSLVSQKEKDKYCIIWMSFICGI